ncbi:hypothetical protein Dcar01_01140 [Deinococcus carri]|uniref:Phosphatidic acid phosphatase type 2/haloperoxidase domain-containing protein n=1 Tax=Deinococcus carri TaxID=1211323 RepID=A0ABP9W5S8_9DEIO
MTFLRSLIARFPWLLALLLGVGIPVAMFAKTAQEVWEEGGFSFDMPTLEFIHRFATPALDHLMVFITTLAGPIVLPVVTLLLAALFWWRHHHRWAVYLILTVGGASGLMFVIKTLVHRVRPHLWVSPAPETDFGFPSGHSTASVSLALILLAWPTRWRWPVLVIAVVYALLVGFSRLYLGVHYPSDVLGAWGAGIAWTAGLYWVLFQKRGAA